MIGNDQLGLWADHPVIRERGAVQAPRDVETPVTGWQPPKDFPNLSGVKVIGLDTETKDLNLIERGPGSVRGDAHAVGVSVATDTRAWYFPLRHEYEPQSNLNMDPTKVFRWLSDVLSRPVSVVGANLLYDLEVLRAEGVTMPTGELFDIQYAEPLIDELASSYSLEALARKYLGRSKDTPALYEWCSRSFGGAPDGKQRKHIWHSPPTLVGPYAEDDATLPLEILEAQRRVMDEEELTELFRVECALIPMLLAMRFRGVCVDEGRARESGIWLRGMAKTAQDQIPGIDVWSNDNVARAFDKAGLSYPRTEAGAPSFTRPFLEGAHHPLATAILDVRLYEKAANPFIESYLLGNLHNGRVHCQFNPLRSDDYGAVSGRFSCSNPNLQNIPIRHKVIGPMLRGLFVPERGKWRRQDYSQVEFRGLVHYAIGIGAEAMRERYRSDPDTDYHSVTIELVEKETGVILDRRPAKNLNFGLVYGMGREKLTRSLGVSQDLGERLYDAYFEAVPSVRATYKGAERLAKRRGYIKTILGRRRRFPGGDGAHTALNALLQGTAADIIKKAMVEIWRSGACDVLGAPHLTVHDELDWTDDGTPEAVAAFSEVERIMVECIKLRVPLKVDVSTGANWGECK